jgi:hypothetical protein
METDSSMLLNLENLLTRSVTVTCSRRKRSTRRRKKID